METGGTDREGVVERGDLRGDRDRFERSPPPATIGGWRMADGGWRTIPAGATMVVHPRLVALAMSGGSYVETLSPVEQAPPSGPHWTFIGASSLPTDPVARRHERRGRRWLVVSFLFCPCHLPILLVAVGAAFGGTALGALITGHALWVGIVLASAYAVLLWRGFRQIRQAKRLERGGGSLRCARAPDGCSVVAADVARLRAS